MNGLTTRQRIRRALLLDNLIRRGGTWPVPADPHASTPPRSRRAPGLCAALLPGHTVPAQLTTADEFELRAATIAAAHGRVRTWDADWRCTYDSSRAAAAGAPVTRMTAAPTRWQQRALELAVHHPAARAADILTISMRHARLQAEYLRTALAEED